MPPVSDHPSLHLSLLAHEYYVVKQAATPNNWSVLLQRLVAESSSLPTVSGPTILSFTRTDEEISIVGECNGEGEYKTGDWRCIKIAGPMDFGLTGVMNAFTDPLRRAGIPIFAISTYNTDYILVPKDKAQSAVKTLQEDGWKFIDDSK